MKKSSRNPIIAIVLLLMVLILITSGCNAGNNSPSKPTAEPPLEIEVPESVSIEIPNAGEHVNKGVFALKQDRYYALDERRSYPAVQRTRLIQGELLLDARMLSKIIGFDYLESQDGNSLQLTLEDTTIIITANSNTIDINGQHYPYPTTVKYVNAFMISAKHIVEALGYTFEYDDSNKTYYINNTGNAISTQLKASLEEKSVSYDTIVYNYDDVKCGQTGVGLYEKTPYEDRLVGIAYTTWHHNLSNWSKGTWNLPLLGKYLSTNRNIIREHGIMLAEAGIDFIFVDWSNNTNYDPKTMSGARPDFRTIEVATDLLFEEWAKIPNAPKICIFVGPGHTGQESVNNGNHQKKVNQVYRDYIENPDNKDMYFNYKGKPLLMCYAATPASYGVNPAWTDDRFTIRWVTGYVGQQTPFFDTETKRSYSFWSWEERGEQTYTVVDGKVEAITCTASSRAQGKEGNNGYIPAVPRNNGATLKQQFQRANDLGAGIVLLVSWNEWSAGEQPSADISKDLEPSEIHGTFYYDLMREQIRKFKGKI